MTLSRWRRAGGKEPGSRPGRDKFRPASTKANSRSGRGKPRPYKERKRQEDSLWRFGGFGRVELHGADDAFAFFDEDHLVRLDIFERFDEAAGPADFEKLDRFGFADPEVHAEIVLRKITAAAAHFVDLRMQALLAGKMRDAFDACADAAAIGFRADGFDFDPIVAGARIAAQKLGKIVDGVDDDIEVAVVVEVAEGAPARGDRRGDARPGVVGNIIEAPVAQILVKQLALRVAGFGLELLDFRIDVAVANENVGPAVVVHVEKPAAPAEILGVLPEAALVSGVLEIGAAEIVVKRGCVAGKICFDEIEIAVEIVIGGGDAHARLRLAIGAESAPRFHGDVGESAVLLILIEGAGGGIVGDVNVRPAIVVKIGSEHAEAEGAVGLQDAGFFAD